MNLRLQHYTCLFIVPLIAIFAAIFSLQPPKTSEQPQQFSIQRTMHHIEQLSASPRPIGSKGHAKAKQYILNQLEQLQVSHRIQPGFSRNSFVGSHQGVQVENIVAELPGRNAENIILLAAHYDSVANSSGANDDASGVAILLETILQLKEQSLENRVIFLFSDGEEIGLAGAAAFIDHFKDRDKIKFAINLEARGNSGPSVMFDTLTDEYGVIERLAKAKTKIVANSFLSAMTKILPNDTDFSVFKRAGIRGLNFAYADNLYHYHNSSDHFASVDKRSVMHQGLLASSIAEHLATQPFSQIDNSPSVYFDFMGLHFVYYHSYWSIFVFLLLCILFFASQSKAFHQFRITAFTLSILLSTLSLAVVAGSEYLVRQYLPHELSLIHSKKIFIGYLLVFFTSVGLSFRWLLRKYGYATIQLGYFSFFLLLNLAVLLVPAMTFQFQGIFFLSLMANLIPERMEKILKPLLWLIVAGLLARLTYMLLIMDGGNSSLVPLFFLLSFFPMSLPFIHMLLAKLSNRFFLATATWAICLLFVFVQRSDFSADYPKHGGVSLFINGATSQTHLVSYSDHPWTNQLVPPDTERIELEGFSEDYKYKAKKIPDMNLAPPAVSHLKLTENSNGTLTSLTVETKREAACIYMWSPSSIIRKTKINQAPVNKLIRFSEEADKFFWHMISGTQSAPWSVYLCGAKKYDLEFLLDASTPLDLKFYDISYGIDLDLPEKPKDLAPASWTHKTYVSGVIAP